MSNITITLIVVGSIVAYIVIGVFVAALAEHKFDLDDEGAQTLGTFWAPALVIVLIAGPLYALGIVPVAWLHRRFSAWLKGGAS